MTATTVNVHRGRRRAIILGALPHVLLLALITIQAVGSWHSDGRQVASGWLMLEICIVPVALAVGGLCALASDLRAFGVTLIKTTLASALATTMLTFLIAGGPS